MKKLLIMNKHIAYFIKFFIFFIVFFGMFFYYFFSAGVERDKQRELIQESKSVGVNFTIHYDDFVKENINIINERRAWEFENTKHYKTDEVSPENYLIIKDFSKKYIEYISKNFNPIMNEVGYCEILINLKNKKYDFISCNENFIFQRSVEIAIEKFNDDFFMYGKTKEINKKITIYFKSE